MNRMTDGQHGSLRTSPTASTLLRAVVVLTTTLGILLSGCRRHTVATSAPTPAAAPANPIAESNEIVPPAVPLPTSFLSDGDVYVGACLWDDETETATRRSVSYQNFKYSFVRSTYADGYCEVEPTTVVTEIAQEGQVETSASGDSAAIDFTVHGFTILTNDPDQVIEFNVYKYCGFDGWSVGQARTVAGLTCSGTHFPASGAVFLGRFRRGNHLLQYALGSTDTPTVRPVGVDRATFRYTSGP